MKIFITGATSGIGYATALSFGRQYRKNLELVLCGRRQEKLDLLSQELQTEFGCTVRRLCFDLMKADEIAGSQKSQPDAWANVDVLINNAGLARGTDTLQAGSDADWDEMIDTNVKGLLRVSRLILPGMLARKKGFIVNMGSVAGRWVYPGGGVYCASKFAVRALSEAMRMETLGQGIRVTNIEPGMVETEFSQVRFRDSEKAKKVYAGIQPLTAEDIARTIVWCVQQPEHMNIQELVIYPTNQASPYHIHRE
ncbi:MAG: SDR family NAD(P)-dependent oxidoreductase [Bdellovibrionales bacterium]|nr:SDR family NAD(P)-dependent oxidoreductase [Bdellovibrionales bacterium]